MYVDCTVDKLKYLSSTNAFDWYWYPVRLFETVVKYVDSSNIYKEVRWSDSVFDHPNSYSTGNIKMRKNSKTGAVIKTAAACALATCAASSSSSLPRSSTFAHSSHKRFVSFIDESSYLKLRAGSLNSSVNNTDKEDDDKLSDNTKQEKEYSTENDLGDKRRRKRKTLNGSSNNKIREPVKEEDESKVPDIPQVNKENEQNDENKSHTPPIKEEFTPRNHKKSQTTGVHSERTDNQKHADERSGFAANVRNESNYYAILGIKKNATSKEVIKAYRRCAILSHPDKLPDGDRRAFDKVSQAYDVLKNIEKRAVYDRYGENGATNGGRSSFREDVMKSFFGNMKGQDFNGSFSNRAGNNGIFQPQNQDIKYQLEVTLEELYNGVHKDCDLRSARGVERKTVTIPRGNINGSTVVLPGEVDYISTSTPADIIFVIAQKKHKIFTRSGHDLAFEVKLSLKESICGFTRDVTHLDGRKVVICGPTAMPTSTSLGKKSGEKEVEEENNEIAPCVIRDGDVHVLKGEGMPRKDCLRGPIALSKEFHNDRCAEYGDLYIQYKIDIPLSKPLLQNKCKVEDNLSTEEREQLGRLLDKLEGKKIKPTVIEKDRRNIRQLMQASAAEFGCASGEFEKEDDVQEHFHHNEQERYNGREEFPFFPSVRPGVRSQYFSQAQGMKYETQNEDDGNVQCQQM